ncbi:MAG TPA: hypothetical protein VFL60_07210 [Gaiellaceae bacterium]|nr:hypothetical protein [Gaiellaceae bacterium]
MSALLSTLQELPDAELVPLARRAAVGSLAGGIAHDAGNALFGILGLLELATPGLPADPGRLELLRAAAGDLDGQLRPLLRFVREDPLPGPGDLAAATREALALYRHGDRKDLALEGAVPETPVPVAGAPAALVQAAVHLLLAAEPGAALRVDVAEGRLAVGPAGPAETLDTVAAARIAAAAGGRLAREGDALVLSLPPQ